MKTVMKKMGWIARKSRRPSVRKCELERSLEDKDVSVAFNSAKEMFASLNA